MVSTPLLLTNLKLLSVVNSDSHRAVAAALLHATHVSTSSSVHRLYLFYQLNANSSGYKRLCLGFVRYIGALGARVICDNIPGLVTKQRQLCQRHPDIMQAIGEGTKEWIRECQHQFRHHRWNCSTLDRDHTVFGRVLLRSKSSSMCPFFTAFPPALLFLPSFPHALAYAHVYRR